MAVQMRCLDCGRVVPRHASGRCAEHRAVADARRRHRRGARYAGTHQRARRAWATLVASGRLICPRCHELIDSSAAWDLDHLPDGTSRPSHAACNRRHITRPRAQEAASGST